jgi:iron complex transport system substrate-binding protein
MALLAACAPVVSPGQGAATLTTTPVSETWPRVLTDDLGWKIALDSPPERIISLAPSNTEILFALGVGEKVVGVTQFCNYPEEAKAVAKVGGFATADVEKVVSLNPDLVFVGPRHEKEVAPALNRVGIKTFALNPKTVDGVLDSIRLAGQATGREKEAEKLAGGLKARMDAVTAKTVGMSDDKRVRTLYVNWYDPIKSAGRDTFADDLIRRAGGVNITSDFSGYNAISLEVIVSRNPEAIIVTNMATPGSAVSKAILTEPRLAGVEARVKGRVYEIDSSLIERAGPRLFDGLEQVASRLHPELWASQGGKQ